MFGTFPVTLSAGKTSGDTGKAARKRLVVAKGVEIVSGKEKTSPLKDRFLCGEFHPFAEYWEHEEDQESSSHRGSEDISSNETQNHPTIPQSLINAQKKLLHLQNKTEILIAESFVAGPKNLAKFRVSGLLLQGFLIS
jgi:hypothetical protein